MHLACVTAFTTGSYLVRLTSFFRGATPLSLSMGAFGMGMIAHFFACPPPELIFGQQKSSAIGKGTIKPWRDCAPGGGGLSLYGSARCEAAAGCRTICFLATRIIGWPMACQIVQSLALVK